MSNSVSTYGTGINRFQERLQAAINEVTDRPVLYGCKEKESNQANAQWVYGERLSALFGTCVAVEGASKEYVHFSVFATCSFACNVSQVTVTGVRNGRFQMSMLLTELENQEAIEELQYNSGI